MSYSSEYPPWYDDQDVIDEVQLSYRRVKRACKQHRCCGCNKPITVGASYVREAWLVEGEFRCITRHHDCLNY